MLILILFSCKNENIENKPETYSVNGVIQKGPFIQGSEVRLQTMSNELVPTGSVFFTETKDDFGAFELKSQIDKGFIDVSTTGFYFNEVSGELSRSYITLKLLTYLDENNRSNVNVLTTLEYERIKYLILTEKKAFDVAKSQAEKEVLKVFSIVLPDSLLKSFDELDLSATGIDNSILLAISAILQFNNSEAQLSELITKISVDLSTDGIINNSSIVQLIATNSRSIESSKIASNLTKRYSDLGLTVNIPDFDNYLDRDGDGVINMLEVSDPVFNYKGDTYSTDIKIQITCPTLDAIIYYTIDGTSPSINSLKYNGLIDLQGDNKQYILKAIAIKPDLENSNVVSNNYFISYPVTNSPIFENLSGTYTNDILVKLKCSTPNANIYYTIDGTKPTLSSTVYAEPVQVSGNLNSIIIRVFSSGEKLKPSSVSYSYYKIDNNYSSVDFIDTLSLSSYRKYFIGKWIGSVSTPWTKPYNVEIEFNASGYSAKTISNSNNPAFYYGMDNGTYLIDNIPLNKKASGEIVINFGGGSTNTGTIKNISFYNSFNNLTFDFLHRNEYGPISYNLTRIK